MNFLHDLLAGATAERLGRTLLHFGWQGAVIALALAGALRLCRGRSAGARYALCCFALVVMATTPAATFWLLPPATRGADARRDATVAATSPPAPAHAAAGGARRAGAKAAPVDGAAAHRPTADEQARSPAHWVTVFWAAGVAALLARMLLNSLLVGRLRRTGTPLPADQWERLRRVARRIGLRRTPRVLQSAWLEVPTVVGWVRPLVLLPAGLVCGLTAFEVEAILAHEFAHIRRRDGLVNFIQSLVEVFLFYHPATWWVSGRIRAERENCCDDVAAAVSGDRLRYARVLARMEGLRAAPAQAVLAASGGVLLSRVRRLLEGRESDQRPGWRLVAGCAALALCSLVAGGGSGAERPAPAAAKGRAEPPVTPAPAAENRTAGADVKPEANPSPARPSGSGETVTRPGPAEGQKAPPASSPPPADSSEARGAAAPNVSRGTPFDRLPSLTESQRAAVQEFRRAQEPPAGLTADRQALFASLSEEQRRQLREAMARWRVPPAKWSLAPDDLPFLTEDQRKSFVDIHRRHMELEQRVQQARRAIFSTLTPEQRRQLQAMRSGQAATPGREATMTRGVVERVEGQSIVIRAHLQGGPTKPVKLEAREGTVVVRDGRNSELADLRPGDRVRAECPGGIATRIEARSAGHERQATRRPPGAVRRGAGAASARGERIGNNRE